MADKFFDAMFTASVIGGSSGPTPVIVAKNITANGTYSALDDQADGYNPVVVNVPNTYTAGDEGKVVSGGELVAQTATSTSQNGTVDTTLHNSIAISVPSGGHEVVVTTLPNAAVTISDSSNTYTATADENGIAAFTGVVVGTYTVTATIDDAESDSTTLTVTDFSATEDSFATLTVSASDNCTITVTDGSITKTLSYTGTPIVQYVSLGTWTVSATIESTLITRTVSVRSYSNQSIYLAPAPPVTIVSRTVDFKNFTSYSTLDVSGSSVYTNMKRCNVADDGTINAFDGDTGYVEDGTNGQVMVYVPKFWYKLDVSESGSLDGNNIRKGTWSIADGPSDGYKLHPAFINAYGNEVDYFLYGAFDAVGQDSNGTYSTSYNSTSYKLGSVGGNRYAPSNSFTRATARTMATNRGTGWYQAGVKQTMAIQMLFAVEYGFNSQTTLGNGIVSASAASNTGTTTGSASSGDLSGKKTAVNYLGI